jgi:hypothetical protein
MKRLLVVAVTGVIALAPAAAMADVQALTVDSNVQFIDGDRVRVSGTITCDVGERFRVGVPAGGLTTNAGTTNRRSGPDTGNCTGAPQTWRVVVQRDSGPSYAPGQTGTVQARAQSGVPGDTEPNDTETVTNQPITIN